MSTSASDFCLGTLKSTVVRVLSRLLVSRILEEGVGGWLSNFEIDRVRCLCNVCKLFIELFQRSDFNRQFSFALLELLLKWLV